MTKIIGGTVLVAGTSIGAAMIAMPITAAKIGFISSIILMAVVAWVMYYLAQINLEIFNIQNTDNGISKIAGDIIGRKTEIITTLSILALLVSLMASYISGLGEIITTVTNTTYKTSVVLLVGILSISLGFSQKIFDYYNRIAFSLKLLVMAIMAIVLAPHVSSTTLIENSLVVVKDISVLTIMPVFITSFGFHGSIPFIYKFLDKDPELYSKSTLYGTIITFIIYIIWLTLSFGVINSGLLTKTDSGLSQFISLFNIDSEILSKSINLFALFAILTSLFGVAAGLYDFIEELMNARFKINNRSIISGMVFIIPGIFCIFGKSLFINALSLAGCALTIIAIIIPTIVRFKLGGSFNKPLLIISCIIGIMTIIGEILSL